MQEIWQIETDRYEIITSLGVSAGSTSGVQGLVGPAPCTQLSTGVCGAITGILPKTDQRLWLQSLTSSCVFLL